MGDARHAMGAVILPHRVSVAQRDRARRAELRAQAAADAVRVHGELLGMDKKRIERFVHDSALDLIGSAYLCRRERLSLADELRQTVEHRVCRGNDPARLCLVRCIKHRDVVFRHDDLGTAAVCKIFLRAELGGILPRLADLAAAGHNEIDLLAAAEQRTPQMVAYDVRDLPGIRRRTHDPRHLRFQRRGNTGADALHERHCLLAERGGELLCGVFAVSCTGKIKDHSVIPLSPAKTGGILTLV